MGLIRRLLKLYLKPKPLQTHQAEIDASTEQLFYEINPRLHFLSGYQDTLRLPVWHALKHIHHVIDAIAGPIDAAARSWGNSPLLRALFASSTEIGRLCQRDLNLQQCLAGGGGEGDCHVVIASTMQVRKVLGIAMRGEILQRDVPQTQISFSDHRIVAADDSEIGLREKLKAYALEFVAHKVLANIETERSECAGLEQELAVLRARLRMKLRQDSGNACLCDRVDCSEGELAEIFEQIKAKEAALADTAIHQPTLDYFMQQLLAVLNNVEKLLQIHAVTLYLDNMNILQETPDKGGVEPLELTEIQRTGHPARVMTIARVPRAEALSQDSMATRIDAALKWL